MTINMKQIEKYILGETDKAFTSITEEDNQQIAVAMIQQTELYREGSSLGTIVRNIKNNILILKDN